MLCGMWTLGSNPGKALPIVHDAVLAFERLFDQGPGGESHGDPAKVSFDEWKPQRAAELATDLSRSWRFLSLPRFWGRLNHPSLRPSLWAFPQDDWAGSTRPCSAQWTKKAWLGWLRCSCATASWWRKDPKIGRAS